MKLSRSMGGLAGTMALTCLLGLASQANAAVVLSGCAGGDFGDACSLSELVSGGSMVINDKRFSNFGLDLFAGQALNASVIRVDTIDTLYDPGFALLDTGGALTFAGGASSFSNLSFDVAVISGAPLIKDIGLAVAVGSITGANSYAHVFANAFDPTLVDLLGQTDAYCDTAVTPGCANAPLTSSALISPTVSGLSMAAGIDFQSDVDGIAQIRSITIQVSQVPEPGSLAIVALGLAGMGVVLRRAGAVARRRHAAA